MGSWIVLEGGRLLYAAFKHGIFRMASVHHDKVTGLIVVGVGCAEPLQCLQR